MKKLLFISLFVIITSSLLAQTWLWGEQGSNKFVGNINIGWAVATDKAHNAYETGYFQDTLNFGTYTIYPDSSYDFFLAKYAPSGNILWTKQGRSIGSLDATSCGYGVTTDNSGNVYVAGSFRDTLVIGSFILANPTNIDAFLAKFDPNGNLLWAKQGKNPGFEANANTVVTDSKGNVYVAGTFQGNVAFGPYTLTSSSFYLVCSFLVKYDSSGNVIWAKQSGYPIHATICGCYPYSISIDRFGSLYMTGFIDDSVIIDSYVLGMADTSLYNMFLVKYDTGGHVIWAKQSTGYFATANSVAPDKDGNVYLGGLFSGSNNFGLHNLNYANPDIFLAKYDSAGNALWAQQGISLDAYNGWGGGIVSTDTLEHVYLTGEGNTGSAGVALFFGNDTIKDTSLVNSSASILLMLDSSGHTLCHTITASQEGGINYVTSDPTSTYIYVTGGLKTKDVFGPDTIGNLNGAGYPFTARWQPCGFNPEGISKLHSLSPSVTLFPNPNNGRFTIELQGVRDKEQVEIYNMLGEKVFEETFRQAQGDNTIDLGAKSPGVYMYRLVSETGEQIAKGKFVIE